MKTIERYDGATAYLSEEVYEITKWDGPLLPTHYPVGTKVRLIGNTKAEHGKHFHANYRTICRVAAKTAEYIGIQEDHLKKVHDDSAHWDVVKL